ncbi:hypothetical protein A3J20_00590 [Candidatus Gottesmanbacteria bacterium RIFCSPLOWO2_02_FULL_42_29]|uniref:Purine nucleoside phosphorylase n=1 Tax=Candidatus Gottesmanbacteria bacterium RIFCSPLOWO2_01_FULL_42_22 TaxID=1798391 RepID=A0A1F6BFW7_9BACT|nr:MAG: hypothetical protein A2781_01340 [Candidatus Gottesmanbacteria bacterium RIFCSPHIGHO2_01_FULL_42_27]OGG21676.1 MAG: hypothetical protein A3E72_05765 [Candidatus Gottesmanbacteria bacterium RIFCSPHIGHO2_12_FULL_43_26]OGG34275.1 MAG: hypothetical protein A3G68_05265 [Candidatus Gottesmanbacteria bacterium RIFCSPLOWO2_12_FULL_42_10]OGG35839.1 MAG: hypothetical protein A2968_05980 [Candidatus Gottesmanbacteria bacterium RIFCSPLOWO2_01_FULL_42_22]OGG37848.1 MAG: hypothetical protein A3J20_00
MIQAKSLLKFRGIKHFFLNSEESVSEEFDEVINSAFISEQVHGSRIQKTDSRTFYKDCDGLLCENKSTLLVKTADCLPVFFYSAHKKTVAAVHAGWRGLSKGIMTETIEIFRQMGIEAASLIAVIGPHIGSCCYQVSADLVNKFGKIIADTDFYQKKDSDYYLDLSAIARYQLQMAGVKAANIEDMQVCTCHNLEYASYRRTNSRERNISLISLL